MTEWNFGSGAGWQVICLILTLFSQNVMAKTIAPPEPVFNREEIIWFDAGGSLLTTCWNDGTVVGYNLATGKVVSTFRIANYDYEEEIHLYLSGGLRPRLAVVDIRPLFESPSGKNARAEAITFYDVVQGKKIKAVQEKIPEVTCIADGAFSEDGRLFYYRTDEKPLGLVCVEIESGKIMWRLPGPKSENVAIKFVPGNDMYISCRHLEIMGKNKSGKIVWQKTVGPPVKNICFSAIQPTGPAVIFWGGDFNLFCLSSLNGNIQWKRPVEKGVKLITVSSDGKKQAFETGTTIQLSFLPGRKTVELNDLKGKYEGVFNQTGSEFICLPKLEAVKEDDKKNTVLMGRKSEDLRVYDAETGELLRQFTLKKGR